MKIIIKNMVSLRCKMLVKSEFEKLGLEYKVVELGEAIVPEKIPEKKYEELKQALHKWGLDVMDNKRSILIEKIKNVIIEMIHYSDELPKTNYSAYISDKLDHDYTYLANLFSEVVGTTIEHFIIAHKVEKVKELLVYDEMNLTEIAEKLHYSSVAHLSNQFKKVTGLTSSHFKKLKNKRRLALENM
jgi:AraC-like DNA-binding protein